MSAHANSFLWQGLVAGHAYSILAAKTVAGFRLLKLRNPWGSFEWKGAWSDKSPQWGQHLDVGRALMPEGPVDDGAFWISWEDFSALYTNIDVCDRSVDVTDLTMNLHEDAGCTGPLYGERGLTYRAVRRTSAACPRLVGRVVCGS